MATRITTKLTLDGHKELSRLLRELPRRVVKKGLRAAISAAATPIVKAAKRGAPRLTGTLKRAIGKKVKTYRNGNVVAIIGAKKDVGSVGSNGKKNIPYFYLHLIEGGVKPHSVRGKNTGGTGRVMAAIGLNPGFPANPFLETAFNEQKDAALGIAESKLKDVIEKEAASLGKK